MTLFRYDGELLERFPTIHAGVIHATGLANGPTPSLLGEAYTAEQRSVIAALEGQALAEVPSIGAWRRTFSGFGVKPTQYRNAAEALLRRLTKAGDIPSINLLVDLGNLVAIRHRMPVAVFDRAQVTGTTTVRFADGTERFNDLGGSETTAPEPGEVVFVDEAGLVSARRWCWRQSKQSAARPSTTEALITVEGLHESAPEDVDAALRDLVELLDHHQPEAATVGAHLSADAPEFG